LEKPAGRARVIVLGGSTAFGSGASSEAATVPGALERLLIPRAPEGRSIEVLNAGVPGYDAWQELTVLESKVLEAQPDLVVVLDGFEDFARSLEPGSKPADPPFFREVDALCA